MIKFSKLEYTEFKMDVEEFVTNHLHVVTRMSDGYHMYTWCKYTYYLIDVIVVPASYFDFNPVTEKNWPKIIPILNKLLMEN